MKRYRFILLFLLAAFTFMKAGAAPAAHQASASGKQYDSFSHAEASLPNEELELGTALQHSAPLFHFSGQIAPLPTQATAKRFPDNTLAVHTRFPDVQLFDNTTLVYNYPSHNFW